MEALATRKVFTLEEIRWAYFCDGADMDWIFGAVCEIDPDLANAYLENDMDPEEFIASL